MSTFEEQQEEQEFQYSVKSSETSRKLDLLSFFNVKGKHPKHQTVKSHDIYNLDDTYDDFADLERNRKYPKHVASYRYKAPKTPKSQTIHEQNEEVIEHRIKRHNIETMVELEEEPEIEKPEIEEPIKKKLKTVPKKKLRKQLKFVYGYAVLTGTNYLVKLKTLGSHDFGRPGVENQKYARFSCRLAQIIKVWNVLTDEELTGPEIDQLKKNPINGVFYRTKIAARSDKQNSMIYTYRLFYTGELINANPHTGRELNRNWYQRGQLVKSTTYFYKQSKLFKTQTYTYEQGEKTTLHRQTYNSHGKVISQYRSKFVKIWVQKRRGYDYSYDDYYYYYYDDD